MKKLIYIILLFILPMSILSCSKDEKNDEWNATYVYLQKTNYLVLNNDVFNLKHSGAGVSGNTSFSFQVKTQKPATKDINVDLIVLSDKISPDLIEFTTKARENEEAQPVDIRHIVIKANTSCSDTIDVKMKNLDMFKHHDDAMTEKFDIVINKITTDQGNTFISPKSQLNHIPTILNKSAMNYLELGTPDNSKIMSTSGWTIDLQPGTENTGHNLIDGNRYSDVAKNGSGFWIKINFNEEIQITGINTKHWAGAYAPQAVMIETSSDGNTWKNWGEIDTNGGEQNLKITSEPKVRFLRYTIKKMPYTGRVDVTEMRVYEKIN